MTLDYFNGLSETDAQAELLKCCGSRQWASSMASLRPYPNIETLSSRADQVWRRLSPEDWLEAFQAHPKIGERTSGNPWPTQEQSGMNGAGLATIEALKAANEEYLLRFGYIFIVCATGKEGEEMLSSLKSRLGNEGSVELAIAAEEQNKITQLRIAKLIEQC